MPTDGRTVFLAPYVDEADKRWRLHVPHGSELAWVFAEPVNSCYYAESIADQTKDAYIGIMDMIARHYSFDSVLRASLELLRRIVNCAVVVEKYFLWLGQFRKTKNLLIADLVQTDLEFLFGNVRTAYDLMQTMLNELWSRTRQPKLPSSFAAMAQMSPSILRSKYGLPEPMVDYYSSSKGFFLAVRRIRDSIYHYQTTGKDEMKSIVFCDVNGFALAKERFFPGAIRSNFDIWPTEKTKPNGLVSVLALVSHISNKTLKATEEFSRALVASIVPPPPLSKSHRVFLRNPYVPHLLRLDEYLDKQWVEGEASYTLIS